ncbi:MAG: SCP2 sterol-binding domain-containing protein, partial [Promethearchaeota archaeon]
AISIPAREIALMRMGRNARITRSNKRLDWRTLTLFFTSLILFSINASIFFSGRLFFTQFVVYIRILMITSLIISCMLLIAFFSSYAPKKNRFLTLSIHYGDPLENLLILMMPPNVAVSNAISDLIKQFRYIVPASTYPVHPQLSPMGKVGFGSALATFNGPVIIREKSDRKAPEKKTLQAKEPSISKLETSIHRSSESQIIPEPGSSQSTVTQASSTPEVKPETSSIKKFGFPKKKHDKPPESLSFEDALNFILNRYEQEKVKRKFRNWHHTLQLEFPDIQKTYIYKINGDSGIELIESSDENPTVKVTMDSDVFIRILTKQINPIRAFSSGMLKTKGEIKNLLKLKSLMF